MTDCLNCSLDGNKVLGTGSYVPEILFIGEAPGYHEVEEGAPFIGKAGQILRSVIGYLDMDDYYITNTVKCRPPENRNPSAHEIRCCRPMLDEEIDNHTPKVIVTLGAVPTKTLLPGSKMQEDRGKLKYTEDGLICVPTFHPAATLYKGGEAIFPFILQDIKKALRIARGEKAHPELGFPDTKTKVVDNDADMAILLSTLEKITPSKIAMDWETYGTSPLWGQGFCVSLSWKPGTAVVIPVDLVEKFSVQLTQVLKRNQLVGYNSIMFDTAWNYRHGLNVPINRDAMLLHYLLDERPQQRSLENLTGNYLDAPSYESEMMAKYECKNKSEMLEVIPHEVVYEYAGKDADWTLRLESVISEELHNEDPKLDKVYEDFLAPATEAVTKMQNAGLWVDVIRLEEVKEDYADRMETLKYVLQGITGNEKFNPNSPKQVQEYLWDKLELGEPNIYGRRPRSVDKNTREFLLKEYPHHPFIQAYDGYQTAQTMFSRYLKNLGTYVEPDGRVRCSYHMDRTETGRLSTTNPAIHQIPKESSIRGIFSAPDGKVLLQADYEQIEMRMVAHMVDDKKLIQLINRLQDEGTDFHTLMASEAYRVPISQVTKGMRQAAKVVSFGLLYLMGDRKLANSTGLPPKEAIEFVKNYKDLMPDVQEFIRDVKRRIREDRYIESPFGRRRRFPLVTTDNIDNLHREGVNFPVQSGASDLTLYSLTRLTEEFSHMPETNIVAMVHDSLVVECPMDNYEEIAGIMQKVMESPLIGGEEPRVPFPIEVEVGKRWGEGKKII